MNTRVVKSLVTFYGLDDGDMVLSFEDGQEDGDEMTTEIIFPHKEVANVISVMQKHYRKHCVKFQKGKKSKRKLN